MLEEIALDSNLDFSIRAKAIAVFIGYEAQGAVLFLNKLLAADEEMRAHARQYIRGLGLAESVEAS